MAIKIISCPHKNCGRVFNNEVELKEHIKEVHYDEKLSIDDM